MIVPAKKSFLKYSILLFAIFPLIPNTLKGLPVIILLIVSLLHIKGHKVNLKRFVINASLYFVYTLSLIYTTNFTAAFNKLETMLSLLIIPLIFYILLPKKSIDDKVKEEFIKLFIFSTTLFSTIIIIAILINSSVEYYKDFYTNKFRIIVGTVPFIGQHPIYASLFLAISLLFIAYIFFSKRQKLTDLTKIIYSICFLLNLSLLVMLSSKSVIISLMLLTILLSIKQIQSKKNFIILSLIILSFLSFFIFNRRMNELIIPATYSNVNSNYSNSYRVQIYKCSYQIIKDNWLTGVGLGDSQDMLNSCYTLKSELLFGKDYNTHNQYLDAWIKTGIGGLMIFIFFLFYNLRSAYQTKNYVLIAIIFLYGLNFLTENILARQSGVILFSFLINFMAVEKNNRI